MVFHPSEFITGCARALTHADGAPIALTPAQQGQVRALQLRVGSSVFEAIVDAYNVLNSDTILSETSTYTRPNGGNWRLPSEILAARFFKFAVQASF